MADKAEGKRIFKYEGKEYPDPDPAKTPDEVRQAWAEFFPELSNAEVKETKKGKDTIIEFKKRVGTKGAKVNADKQCADWNTKYPIHTKVVVTRDRGEKFYTYTRSKAEVSNSGIAVIFVDGISGFYLLDRVKIAEPC